MWLATTKYFCEYFAIYSVFMKIGVKSEIYDCTLALVEYLEQKSIFKKGTFNLLKKDKELRIDNQYYLKNRKINFNYDDVLHFVLEIKELLISLNTEKINKIREEIKEVLE